MEIFRNKLDVLHELMKNGERRELTSKDIYAPRIFHFFDIYKIYDRLQIVHFRGSTAKPALIPINDNGVSMNTLENLLFMKRLNKMFDTIDPKTE